MTMFHTRVLFPTALAVLTACSSSKDPNDYILRNNETPVGNPKEPPAGDPVGTWPDDVGALDAGTLGASGASGGTGGGVGAGGGGGGGGASVMDGGSQPADPVDAMCTNIEHFGTHAGRATSYEANRMASASRVRELLTAGIAPLPASIRDAEILNFYETPFAGASPLSATLDAKIEARKTVIGGVAIPNQYDLFVGLQAKLSNARPKLKVAILADTTASVGAEGLKREQAVLDSLAGGLTAADDVWVLTTNESTGTQKVSVAVNTPNSASSLGVKLALDPNEAPLANAVTRAYAALQNDIAKNGPDATAWYRVIVLSDGDADPNSVPPVVGESVTGSPDIHLLTVGVRRDSSEAFLYRAAGAGRGPYVYVDDANRAGEIVGTRLERLLGVVYDNVIVNIQVPWWAEVLESSAAPSDPDLNAGGSGEVQYLAPGAQMRFLFRLRVCDAQIVNYSTAASLQVQLSVDAATPGAGNGPVGEISKMFKELLGASTPDLDKLLATRAYVSALRAPTPERFDQATQQLSAFGSQAGSTPWTPAADMLGLLAKHPAHP